MTAREILHLLKGVKRSGDGWTAKCPVHDDRRNSLSVSEGEGGRVLLHCHAGCSFGEIHAALNGSLGGMNASRQIVRTYDYRDEHGGLLYQSVRYYPKGFVQRRPDGAGGWVYKLNGTRRVLYRLLELLKADPSIIVFVVEGEKDADRLADLGLLATTNAGGAGKWRDEYSEALRGLHVIIIPDNDDPGRKHAAKVARSLQGVAASVRILELPNLPPKGDVSDWLDAGGSVDELRALAENETVVESAQAPTETSNALEKREHRSQATQLVELAADAELFHSPDGKTFAVVAVNEHRETLLLRGSAFRDWLSHSFYSIHHAAPSSGALQDALNAISGKARFDGAEAETFMRVAGHGGAIYLDLCDSRWRAVEIRAEGWQVIPNPPVKFRRTRGMLPLPEPERGGSIEELKRFLNVGSREDWVLLCSWLIAAFRYKGPYPLLALHGEQGSAKSTTARALRSLVDPNTASLRSEPREERDLQIAAANGWCAAFDNLSRMPQWLSDSLCRLATGGGFATRQLYADEDEILFDAMRPVLLTGIEEVATRPDLLDRAIILYLPSIPEERRRVESAFWMEFNGARPRILGALLDAVSAALRNEQAVTLGRLPRMADFAVWATAAEEALGFESGAFMAAYDTNRAAANALALEGSPISAEILKCMAHRDSWTLTYTELHAHLERTFGDNPKRPEGWPKSARGLAGELRRIAVNLRKAGVDVTPAGRQGGSGRMLVTLSHSEQLCERSSQHSQSSQPGQNEDGHCEDAYEDRAEDSTHSQQHSQVNIRQDGFCEDCERGECRIHTFSGDAEWANYAEVDSFFRALADEEAEHRV